MATQQTPLSGQSIKRFRLDHEYAGGQFEEKGSFSKKPLDYMDYEETVSSTHTEEEHGWLGNVSQAASSLLRYGSGLAAKVGSLFSWKWVDNAAEGNEHVDDYDYYAMPGQKRKLNSEVSIAELTAEPEKFVRVTPPDSKSEVPFNRQSVFQLPFRNATQKEALEKQMADSPSRRSLRTPRRSVQASRISTSIKSPTASIQSALIKPSDVVAENLAVEIEKAHDVLNASFVEGVSSRSTPALVAANVVAEKNSSIENTPQDLSSSFTHDPKDFATSSAEKENSNSSAQMTPDLHQDSVRSPFQMQDVQSAEADELAANSQSPAKGKENVELVSPDSPVGTPTMDDEMEEDVDTVVASSQQEAETEGESNIHSLQCPVSSDEFSDEEEEDEEDGDEQGENDGEGGEDEEVLAGHFENEELDKTLTEKDREGQVTEEDGMEPTDREISYDEIAEDGETESTEFSETSFVKKVHRKSPALEFDTNALAFLAPSVSEVFDPNANTDYLSQLKAFVSASQDGDDNELMQSLEEAFSGDDAYVGLPGSNAEVPSISSSENSPQEADESITEEHDAQEVAQEKSASQKRRDRRGRFVALPTAQEEDEEEEDEEEKEEKEEENEYEENQEGESPQVSDVSGMEQDDDQDGEDGNEEEQDGQEEEEDDDEEIICEGMYVQSKPSPFVNRRVYVPADEEDEEEGENEEEEGNEESGEEEEVADDEEEEEGEGAEEVMNTSMSVRENEGEDEEEDMNDEVEGGEHQDVEGDWEEE